MRSAGVAADVPLALHGGPALSDGGGGRPGDVSEARGVRPDAPDEGRRLCLRRCFFLPFQGRLFHLGFCRLLSRPAITGDFALAGGGARGANQGIILAFGFRVAGASLCSRWRLSPLSARAYIVVVLALHAAAVFLGLASLLLPHALGSICF